MSNSQLIDGKDLENESSSREEVLGIDIITWRRGASYHVARPQRVHEWQRIRINEHIPFLMLMISYVTHTNNKQSTMNGSNLGILGSLALP